MVLLLMRTSSCSPAVSKLRCPFVAGLVIETDADGGKRCTGVRVWDGHQLVTASATREVALSAGSIGSAQILQLSGIGPAQLLQQHGGNASAAARALGISRSTFYRRLRQG